MMPTRHRPAWFDAQYNNRARVANSTALLQRWARASAQTRERIPAQLDLAYGDAASERLDLFPTATATAPAPVLVFIHGGWWRALDKSDHSFVAAPFADAGALVIVPNYALCPAVGIEQIALQMTRALAWAWRHAAEHGGDPGRIVVAGHSAGGHLAAMLSCCDWPAVAPDLPRRLISGAVSISGVHDLAPIRQAPFLQGDLRLDEDAVRRLSPVNFPPPATPLHAFVGGAESEEFKRQNRLIRRAWGRRAVPICAELPGRNHFDVLDDLVDSQGRSHRLTRELLGLRLA
jgi:arylformamidase